MKYQLKSGKVFVRMCDGLINALENGDALILNGDKCDFSITIENSRVYTNVIYNERYNKLDSVLKYTLLSCNTAFYQGDFNSLKQAKKVLITLTLKAEEKAVEKAKNTDITQVVKQEKALRTEKYKEMKIKSIRLFCFIYLGTSAIALFLQNFRKIPQDTNGFILGYTVNILGIEFNTQVIDGRIIFIALGRFGFLVTNIYNVYDTVLNVYKCFCEYYSYFTWGYIKLIKKLYKNNEYIQNKKIHDLVFKMNGTYQEKIGKGV